MNKEQITHMVEEHFRFFPDSIESLASTISYHLNKQYDIVFATIEDVYVVKTLKKEVFQKASFKSLQNTAKTLKYFLANPEGKNLNAPHLAHLHVMSRYAQYRTLMKYNLILRSQQGNYNLTAKGRNMLSQAYDLKQASLRTQNNLPSASPPYEIDAPSSVL